MKNSALRDRINPKDQLAIAAVCVVGLAHEDEDLEGVGSRPAQALFVRPIRQHQRHLAPGSWSNPSAHGQNTTSFSCTRILLIVLDPAKVPRIASNFLERAPQHSSNLHRSLRHPVPQRHRARKDTRTVKWFSSCHCRVVSVGPIPPKTLPRLLLRCLRLHLPPRPHLRKHQRLSWHPMRCQRCLLLHPHPSYMLRSRNSLLKHLMTTHSSCAILLLQPSSLYLRLHPHQPLVHQAQQPYHHLLRLHPSFHTLLLRQRAGSSGAPHHHTSKRHSHNHHSHHHHRRHPRPDTRRHTLTPPRRQPAASHWTQMACRMISRPGDHYMRRSQRPYT